VSGDLPEPCCTHRVAGWFIPGVSPIKTCDVHREVLVDVKTGLRVPVDDGTREVRREVYEFWPSELLMLFERAGLPRRSPPPYLPDTAAEVLARTGEPPRNYRSSFRDDSRDCIVGFKSNSFTRKSGKRMCAQSTGLLIKLLSESPRLPTCSPGNRRPGIMN